MSPEVSILVLTYNHERYLAQAFEGLHKQQTTFPYEVVVANDCSSDGTAAVVETWSKVFGDRMRILPRPQNLGITRNFVDALSNCRGRYVAILEGDDYWTDQRKLQRQRDFLTANQECSACCHRVKLLLDDHRFTDWTPLPGTKPRLEFLDVLVENFVPGCSSLMFRNDPGLRIPDWLTEINYYDWVLNVANAEHGALGFIEDSLSVYRVHSGGAWSGKTTHEQVAAVCDILGRLNEHFEHKFDRLIRAHLRCWQYLLSIRLLEQEVKTLTSDKAITKVRRFLSSTRISTFVHDSFKKLAIRIGRKAA